MELMHLKILLPSQVFADKEGVARLVTETTSGSFGFLPHRLDCVAALVPGILAYETRQDGETYVAVDQGVLVKSGLDVWISVREAIGGADLGRLREAVDRKFLRLDERERDVRSALAKMESGFIRRFMELHHD